MQKFKNLHLILSCIIKIVNKCRFFFKVMSCKYLCVYMCLGIYAALLMGFSGGFNGR